MKCGAKTLDELHALSDLEIHHMQIKYGLPNIPVTETTRNVLINRLYNRIKNQNFKQQKLSRETEDIYVPTTILKRKPTMTYLQHKPFEYDNYNTTKSQRGMPINRYSLSPILTTNENENGRKQIFLNTSTEKSPTYGNNFQFGAVGRLLSLRDSTLAKSSVLPKAASSLNDYQKVPQRTNKFTRKNFTNFIKQIFTRFALRNETQIFISQALVWAFFTFFIVIALVYTLSNPDQMNTIHEITTRSIVCDLKTNKSQLAKDCIEEKHLSSALDLNKRLFLILQDRAKHHHCVNKSKSPALSVSAFMEKRYNTVNGENNRPAVNIIHDIKHLILNNPHWQIGLVDENGKSIDINSKNELPENEVFFRLLKPNLPILCVLYNKINQFFIIVGIGAIVSITALLCYSLFTYLRNRAEISGEEKSRFISEIINELSTNCYENEVILNHLRDKLLPIQDRKKLLDVWNEAVKVLERSESRIQFTMKLKNGEKVRTIKWIGNVPGKSNQNHMANIKQWQSPAFDNTHQIIRPPTSCLKIRHMFDTTEICNPSLDQLINNAIIEKVGQKCRIIDIKLDKQTCCVYVRCATEEDAGIVHNEINGWWFDKRLLSIKFLRLERFITRFPKSEA